MGRRSRLMLLVAPVALLAVLASTRIGFAEDPTAQRIREGLESFGDRTTELANDPTLQQLMALTGLDPAGPSGLDLGDLLDDVFAAIPNDATSVSSLQDKLNDDALDASYGGVDVVIGCPGTGCQPAAITSSGGIHTITIPITATRTVDTPLALDTDTVDLGGGTVQAALSLRTTLRFRLDTAQTDDTLAFAVIDSPTQPAEIAIDVDVSTPSPLSFTANIGFTEATVGGTISSAHLDLDVALNDPDSSGLITRDEYASTALADLVSVSKGGSVDSAITLDTTLTAASPDATIQADDGNLTDGFGPISVSIGSLGRLADFRNVRPEQVVAGLAELANGLQGMKSAGDPTLRFLQDGLGKALRIADPVLELVDRFSVVCGTTDGDPPTGDVSFVAEGTTIFCQARTTQAPTGNVSWTIGNGTPSAVTDDPTDGTATAGTAPNASISFSMDEAGTPEVSATFPTASGTRSVARAPASAQELFVQLSDLAGFQDVAGSDEVAYQEATRALTFHLRRTFDPPATPASGEGSTTFDFGDRLKAVAKIAGLNPSGGASVTMDAGQVTVDLTFGVILVPDVNDITPADNTDPDFPPGEVDRFFLKVNPSGHELAYDDASFSATLQLRGQVGYLEVSASGVNDAPGANGQIFRIAKAASGDPILAVDVAGPGVALSVGGLPQTITDAIRVRDLLRDLPGNVTPDLNVRFDAGLAVTASFSGGPAIATGKVGVSWPDVTVGDPVVTADAAFNQQLLPFDTIDPSNPQALLSLILDNLDAIASGIETFTGSDFASTRIPLAGVTPKDLLTQLRRLQNATDELRGASATNVACGTQNTDPPTMPDGQSVDALVFDTPTKRIYCQARNPKDASQARWTVQNASVVANDTSIETVKQDPTLNLSFDVTNRQIASEANPNGWRVNLAFTDEDGEHDVDVPDSSVPTTLQKLEDALESKLGLPESALALALKDFGGVKHVVIRLNASRCTSGNQAIETCAASDSVVPKLSVPIAFDLGSDGGLVGIGSTSNLQLEYIARAKLNLAVPLTASPVPVVLDSSGIDLQAGVHSDTLNLTANLGPLTLALGTTVDTDPGTDGVQAGAGKGRLGAKFSLANSDDGAAADPDAESDEDTIPIATYATGIAAAFGNPSTTATGCGSLDDDDDASPDPVNLDGGAGCARLALGFEGTYLGDLGIRIGQITDTGTWRVITPQDLEDKILAAILDWDRLLESLTKLLEKLEATLDGTASGAKIPLVGDTLDAGADIVGKIRALTQAISDLKNQVNSAGDLDGNGTGGQAGDAKEKIQQLLFAHLGPGGVDLLQDTQPAPGVDNDDIGMILTCGGALCLPSSSLASISDVRLIFTIGQGSDPVAVGCAADCEPGAQLPFDIGLDGLPVRLTGNITASLGWRANLDFGLSRADGPYLVTGGASHPAGPEVRVSASVNLGDNPSGCPAKNLGTTPPAGLGGYDDARCITGELGFLGLTIWDGDTPADAAKMPTSLGIKATLDLTGPNRVRFLDIPTQLGASFTIEGGVNVDALIRTGLKIGESASLPGVLGTFHLDWTWAAGSDPKAGALAISFGDLHLDSGEFITQFLERITREIKNITGPLKPFVDFLQAEVPVVSDLAKLVGAEPVRMITLMEAVSGANLDVIKSVIAFLAFVNNLPSDSGLIPLGPAASPRQPGSFTVDAAKAKAGPLTPDKAGSIISSSSAGGNLISEISGNDRDVPDMNEDRPSTFGVPGLSFPIMDDSGGRSAGAKVFAVLMGQDETLVRYDLGNMEATAGFSYSFGPFFIGPVPVTANIGGSATIRGRFAFGYDTSGLRKVLEGGSGEHLLDGIFLDDLNARGIDVPEVQLIGEVFAGASVNILIFEAGIEGGLRMTVALNLNDSPDPDGKLRIEEIFNKLNNPICLFDVTGRLSVFLRFFLEIDLFLFSERFTFDILDITLLDFAAACSPPQPVLGEFEPGGQDGLLVLNIGSQARRDARRIQSDNEDESVTVRPVRTGVYLVSMFGYNQEFGTPGNPVTRISADADTGNDTISLLPGATNTVSGSSISEPEPVPFTATATISGGPGNDSITTGEGDDTVFGDGGAGAGDPGNDKIVLGGGNDFASGGGGNDQIEGSFGDDTRGLNGGDGNDTVNGGPGGDLITGGNGNDVLNGGPAQDPNAPAVGAGKPDPKDGADRIIGGAGADSISGNAGDDELHGGNDILPSKDEAGILTACDSSSGPAFSDENPETDQIQGGEGNDWITGGPDRDQLIGAEGDDRICGNGGRDLLEGDSPTPGNDFLHGGSGNDVLLGFGGDDVLMGASGNDSLDGAEGNDDLIGGTGRDRLIGGDGRDIVLGDNGTIAGHTGVTTHSGAVHDALTVRVKPVVVTPDLTSTGGEAARNCDVYDELDVTAGNADCVHGGAGDDFLFGERGPDRMFGDDGMDYMEGNADADHMRGGLLGDTMLGGAGHDEMFGDSGDDHMFGNDDCDTMRGNQGDDDMEGNAGADTMYGDAGQDNMIGGSSIAGALDDETTCGGLLPSAAGDTLRGNADPDVMAGDNATMTRTGLPDPDDATAQGRTVVLHDVDSANGALGGPDTMEGNEANDRMFGQRENDTMRGGDGIDRMEGNAHTDTMHGEAGDDLMLGGSSGNPATDDDAGDVMNGNDGDDVMLGDNGRIAWNRIVTPPPGTDASSFGDDTMHGDAGQDEMFGELGDDTMFGDADEDHMLGDRGVVTPQASPQPVWPGGAPNMDVVLFEPNTGGVDTMHGNGADDHMFGGWEDDTMEGGPADDHMQGNGGRDRMFGLADTPTVAELLEAGLTGDEDDMIGGTSETVSPDPRLDEGELEMEGNLEQDVMTGDNANIVRIVDPSDDTQWAIDPITGGAARIVTLLDRTKTGAALDAVSGSDTMLGNEGNDRMYGEGGDDCMKGNAQDDYLEGNQDSDFMEGNGHEDDLIGGSSFESAVPGVGDPDAADTIFGGGDDDIILGDNAVLTRDPAVLASPHWDTVRYNWIGPDVDRFVRFWDLGPLNTSVHGGDTLSGGQGSDVLLGQDGDDRMYGGTEDDAMEGNGGADVLYGDADAPTADPCASPAAERNGPPGTHGQDDQIGGSSLVVSTDAEGNIGGHRDAADEIHGDGNADFQLGDNGRLLRRVLAGVYKTYLPVTGRATVVRQAAFQADPETVLPARYDVGAPAAAGVWGGDTFFGDAGDDYQFGQDGDDVINGNGDDDDQYGELGDDRIFGHDGEDAQVGDRGMIVNRRVPAGEQITYGTKGPGFFQYRGLFEGQYDRRVTLTDDGDGDPMPALGIDTGGNDRQRGGGGHDSMHGAFGDDLMNGDAGGDWLFGDDGADVMWGGKGVDPSSTDIDDHLKPGDGAPVDLNPLNVRGANDRFVDFLFGGYGGPGDEPGSKDKEAEVLAADILDFLPRSAAVGFTGDPDAWFEMTDLVKGVPAPASSGQHHQGIDWIYGGYNRDVLEGDVGKNGPDLGDRLMDWNGAYNLYTRCNPSYGDDGDIRQHSPAMQELLLLMAYGSGAGLTADEVRTEGTSAFRELALVYPGDKENMGPAFPTTPGHFQDISCTPGT